MGITGLIPFLEKASQPVNISQFSGCTVAVDAYCWLHKGAFACAEKLARGDHTDQYVYYCMKYVNMLLHHNIKPILVFDGGHLNAKADTEKKRRESREVNRRKAAELLRLDRPNEAKTFLRRCVDVTHEMALNLIQECRSRNVDCIVAPFEADAQLAYFSLNDIADIVITEDSDLLLFGCKKVLFKMDVNGNGLLVDQKKLHLAMGIRESAFSLEKFRHMCILSGCDYLPSLPGIGLAKACRFITRSIEPDIHKALTRLPTHLNMSQLSVTPEYRDKFVEADLVFKHQPVFDPFKRKIVPLTDPPEDVSLSDLWVLRPDDQAEQLALGNLNPFSLKKMDDWHPNAKEKQLKRSKSWNGKAPHKSIWSPDFLEALKKKREEIEKKKKAGSAFVIPSTLGKQVVQKAQTPTKKRVSEDFEDEKKQFIEMYGSYEQPAKRLRMEDHGLDEPIEEDDSPIKPKTPVRVPFSKSEVSPVKQSKSTSKHKRTVLDDNIILVSGYFCNSPEPEPEIKQNSQEIESSQDFLDEPIEDLAELDRTCQAAELLSSYHRKPLVDIKNTSPPTSPEKMKLSDLSPPPSPELITSKSAKPSMNPFSKKCRGQKDENESLLDTIDEKTQEAVEETKRDMICAKNRSSNSESKSRTFEILDSSKIDSSCEKNKSFNTEIDISNRGTRGVSHENSSNKKLARQDVESKPFSSSSTILEELSTTSSQLNNTNSNGGSAGNFNWAKKFDKYRSSTIRYQKSPASSQEFKSPAQNCSTTSPPKTQPEEVCKDTPVKIDSNDTSLSEKSQNEEVDTFPIKEHSFLRPTLSQESDEGFCSPSMEVKSKKGTFSLRQATPTSTRKSLTPSACRRVGLSKKSPTTDLKQSSLKSFLFKPKPKLN